MALTLMVSYQARRGEQQVKMVASPRFEPALRPSCPLGLVPSHQRNRSPLDLARDVLAPQPGRWRSLSARSPAAMRDNAFAAQSIEGHEA
jgi:hypothetical protein